MDQACISCVLQNLTYIRNVFPYSKYENECVSDLNDVELGTLSVYRACKLEDCLRINLIPVRSIIPILFCEQSTVFESPPTYSLPLLLLLVFLVVWLGLVFLCFGVDRGIEQIQKTRQMRIF